MEGVEGLLVGMDTIMAVSSKLVHCKVAIVNGSEEFFCTILYAFKEASGILEAWRDLEEIAKGCTRPWILTRDFNCVQNLNERIGGAVRPHETDDLRRCMEVCGLKDMTSTCCFYTWNNKQTDNDREFCKLDRVMINDDWESMFPTATSHFMPEGSFDHSPILVNVYPQFEMGRGTFEYLKMWSIVDSFNDIIEAS